MSQQPDVAKVLGSLGCLVMLIPIVLILVVLFVAIAIGSGTLGVGAAIMLIGLVVLAVARARRPKQDLWRCPGCNGVFRAALPANCPHCGANVVPKEP